MCLIAFALDAHPDYALVLAANRDEFYDRPTAPAHFWEEAPGLLAGRDERAGGTWLGISRTGRFAALTNVRAPDRRRENAPSRGALVTDFIRDDCPPMPFMQALAETADRYNGFNLLAGTFPAGQAPTLVHFTNHTDDPPRAVRPGLHGLSNATLNTDWPKVTRSKARLQRLLDEDRVSSKALLELLNDRAPAPEEALPATGMPHEWERALSSVFIQAEGYGTRSSTALLIGRKGEVAFVERSFEEGTTPRDRRFAFQIKASDQATAPAGDPVH